MKKFLKRTSLVALLAGSLFAINLIWFKPFFINHFYTKVFAQFAWDSPMLLTNMGMGFKKDQLDDNSLEAIDKQLDLLKKSYAQLLEYDRDKYSGQEGLSYDILAHFLSDQIDSLKFKHHAYSVTQRGGSYQNIVGFLSDIHLVKKEKDLKAYLSRVSQIGTYFDNTLESVAKEKEMGIVPPDFVIKKVIENLHNIRDPALADNPLLKDFNKKVDELDTLSDPKKADYKQKMLVHMNEIVNPAYDRYIAFFEDLQKIASPDAGAWKLPKGDAYYQYRIKSMTTTDYSAEQLHELGLKDVARIHAEMSAALESQGLSGKSIGELMHDLGEDPRFLYPDTNEGREQILKDYETIITEIDAAMDEVFDIRPKAEVVVKRVPEYREKTAAGGSYSSPAIDGSRPGIFYANLYDVSATPKWAMRTLAYHEAVPGHHFQIAINTELEGLPMFRSFMFFPSYSEGWALYAERLAWEQGFQDDPFSNLGRLQDELLRAVRLVVDTGIHHKRWTREKAIEYMATTTGMAMTDVESEIERYIVWPAQALTYKVGMLKILELRERSEKALGDKYDIRKFHNVVLKNGAVPMSILERLVDEYIARGGDT